VDEGCPVVPIPGPSAVNTALSASGIPCSEFVFLGFISSKESRRRRKLTELNERRNVFVFYESPHRLLKFLGNVLDIMGDIRCCVAKEMTKKFEKYYRGRISEIIDRLSSEGVRGEYTVIVDNRAKDMPDGGTPVSGSFTK
jgi:16S rRNA (cytidine1402-2'-O)-methyltransferase